MDIDKVIKEIQKGNTKHFKELYDYCQKSLYYAIYSTIKDQGLIEDIMQDTFLEFLKGAKKFDIKADIKSYLIGIARNITLNYLRKLNRIELLNEVQNENSLFTFDKYSSTYLDKIKKTLSYKEYQIFALRILGEYSFEQISELTKYPLGTCTWIYQEARKKLKEAFKDER